MRRVINHQLKGEIGTAQQSAINGSAKIALGTFDVELSLDKFKGIELQLKMEREGHKGLLEEIQREKRNRKLLEREVVKQLKKKRKKAMKLSRRKSNKQRIEKEIITFKRNHYKQ